MRITGWVTVAALAGAACGGRASTATGVAGPPLASSAQAAQEFMRAAKDSNLARMAQLWGTSKGPASVVGVPADYQRIMVVIQAYIRGDSAVIASDMAMAGDDRRRKVGMSLYRGSCVKVIPLTMVRTPAAGWIVNAVDLPSAGNPARPCEPVADAQKP